MKRLFGGATLLLASFSADAGLIRLGAGYQLDGSDLLSNGSRRDSGAAWPGLGAPADMLALPAQDRFDDPAAGPGVTRITFLSAPPAEQAPPVPEPATLALLGLGAGALGLARQSKGGGKRA